MKIRILAVGTKMPSWVEQGFSDYTQRLKSTQSVDLVEIPLAKRGKNSDIKKAMAAEADAIQKQIRVREKMVILDVIGKPLSTQSLARKLADWQMDGSDIALVVGGPDGLDPRFKKLCQESWSLSDLTLPHPLVRLVLIEQLYRGLMINANHPYHRE